jgi:Protein of unknown function with PCYCGC motif
MRRYLGLSFVIAVLTIGLALCAGGWPPSSKQTPASTAHHNFHEAPSTGRLPPVLGASQFEDNPAAYVAYSLASRIPQTLYQVPCYCGCDRNHGHESLLDCFTGQHGTHCRICQKEAVFCFLEENKGKTPAEIREAMGKGQVSDFDLDKYTRRFYSDLRKSEK